MTFLENHRTEANLGKVETNLAHHLEERFSLILIVPLEMHRMRLRVGEGSRHEEKTRRAEVFLEMPYHARTIS